MIGNDVIESWCENKWIPSPQATEFVGAKVDAREFAKAFTSKGMRLFEDYESGKRTQLEKTVKSLNKGGWLTDEGHFLALAAVLSENPEGNDLRELAALMSMRTYYGELRHLTLGTIIGTASVHDRRYLLCLQPLCDSVRLDKPTSFIFCALKQSNGRKASFVVSSTNGFIELDYKPKVRDTVTLKFPSSKGVVVAKKQEDKQIFTDEEGQDYEWLAQMKPSHAQRSAENFAKELGRVGFTESEWLRLRSK